MLVAGRRLRVDADVGDAAVAFGEVHAVAYDEAVGYLEADEVGLDGDEAALGFVEAGGDFQRRGLVREHELAEVAEGEAGIEDVFDEDDVLAFDGGVDVLDELDGAGADTGAAVAGDGDEVEGVVDGDGTGEVGEKDGCAFENADEDDGLTGVLDADLFADGGDALGDLFVREEDVHRVGRDELRKRCGHGKRVARNGGCVRAGVEENGGYAGSCLGPCTANAGLSAARLRRSVRDDRLWERWRCDTWRDASVFESWAFAPG